MNVSVSLGDKASPALRRVIDSLQGAGRRDLLSAMGTEVQHVTTEHLRGLAATRHATAERLGAAPSGHLAQAAEKVAAPAALSANETEATLTFNHPGLGRAFHDVTIVPKTSKYLTIPVNAVAYARRAGEFALQVVFTRKGAWGLVPKDFKLPPKPWGFAEMVQIRSVMLFLLVRSVTQKQDRSLLPSDEEWTEAATLGARNYIRDALQRGGAL